MSTMKLYEIHLSSIDWFPHDGPAYRVHDFCLIFLLVANSDAILVHFRAGGPEGMDKVKFY